MSIQHAGEGALLRQEKYAPSYEKGLLGDAVAAKCSKIEDPEVRALIWFVQEQSWHGGGLSALAEKIMDPDGVKREDPQYTQFPEDWVSLRDSYESILIRLCLNPKCTGPEADCYDCETKEELVDQHDFDLLARVRRDYIETRPKIVPTEITKKVAEAVEYAKENRCVCLVNGEAGLGKSTALEDYAHKSGGLARVIQVPPSTDEISFYRAVARSLGLPASTQAKGPALRAKIDDMLNDAKDLVLIFDEGQYIAPIGRDHRALPHRINWVISALANREIPTVIVTSPLFLEVLKGVQKATAWNAMQFVRRVGVTFELPRNLSCKEYEAIGAAMLPGCRTDLLKAAAGAAEESPTRLGCLKAILKYASAQAKSAGRAVPEDDDFREAVIGRISFEKACLPSADAGGEGGSRKGRNRQKGGGLRIVAAPGAIRAAASPVSRGISADLMPERREGEILSVT